MRKVLFSFLIALFVACGQSEKGYEITGKIAGLDNSTVKLLTYTAKGFKALDSTNLDNGSFSFSGTLSCPDRFYLQIGDLPGYIGFFADNSRIRVSADQSNLKGAKIEGSKIEDQYQLIKNEHNNKFKFRIDSINNLYEETKKRGDTAKLPQINAQYEEMSGKEKVFLMDFINSHPESIISAFLVVQNLMDRMSVDEAGKICQRFGEGTRDYWAVKYLTQWVENHKNIAIGHLAPDFAMKDTAGVLHSLSSLRGKYVLLDFWNTKCGPCRASHPYIRKIYDQYKERGFEIFAVSFDKSRELWIQSIITDRINWLQVSALTGWENEARDLYCIERNPYNFLIDKDGTIIANDLSVNLLSKKLAEIFK